MEEWLDIVPDTGSGKGTVTVTAKKKPADN